MYKEVLENSVIFMVVCFKLNLKSKVVFITSQNISYFVLLFSNDYLICYKYPDGF